jgi:heme exporter protein D
MLKTGSWIPVFYVMIACDIVAAFMALLWLKPLAARTIAQADLAEHEAERKAQQQAEREKEMAHA